MCQCVNVRVRVCVCVLGGGVVGHIYGGWKLRATKIALKMLNIILQPSAKFSKSYH